MRGRRFIVKSTGELEEFDANKLAIVCLKVGVPFGDVDGLVSTVSNQVRDGMSTSELRALVFSYLREKHPEAARVYKKRGEFFVRTTEERIEKWDRERIAESLATETGVEREKADIISKGVEKDLQNLNLDFVSGPLIREMVNVKLLQKGMEDTRAKYTRLGLPVYDVRKLLERAAPQRLINTAGESVLEQYFLLTVPRHLTDAHFRGIYDIPHLTRFALHPMSVQHDVSWFRENGIMWRVYAAPAKRPETAISHSLRILEASMGTVINQGVDSLESILEGFEGDFKQYAQYFLYAVNQEGLECYGTMDLRGEFAAQLMHYYIEGDKKSSFPIPRPVFRVSKKSDPKLVEKAYEYAAKCGGMFASGGSWVGRDRIAPRTGKLHSVTLNLPRAGYDAGGDDDLLKSLIDERLEMVRELLMIKYKWMEGRLENLEFLSQGKEPYFRLKDSSLAVGVVGLNELAKFHAGSGLHEGGADFGVKIITWIRERIDGFSKETKLNWVLSDTGPSERLAKTDIVEFGRESVPVGANGSSYTPSSHVADVDIGLEEKLEIEEKFHGLFNGGQCLSIPIREATGAGLAGAAERLLKSKVSSFAFSKAPARFPFEIR